MPAPTDLPTYRDILDYLADYQRGHPSAYIQRNARRAMVEALRVLVNAHQWPYYTQYGRINTVAPYTTGTVTYDHTGGAYERLVQLTDGEWPEWAPYGILVINNIPYSLSERRSATEAQLDVYQNPTTDIADATTFALYRDTYTLPVDCVSVDQIYSPESYVRMDYVHPRQWLAAHRYNASSANTPCLYTVTGDPDFQGQMAVRFYPYPDQALPLDFMYQRRPRSNNIEGIYEGTVSISEGSYQVTGEGTSWDDTLVGSLLRFSANGRDLPSGLDGVNPYKLERMIMEVVSPTHITVDQRSPWSLSAVKYMVSDPIDIEPGAMQTVFLRCCEAQLGKLARFPDREKLEAEYLLELERAKVASRPSSSPRSMGDGPSILRRLAYMPRGEDVD